ncbi:alternative ribosome rescue aminoacyl-tRNA hydrolase ArfB [Thioalkalicoccus limnaeus]|uniref:Alternative ribosome rescue aminoacyl-tRNA hydrolase ArfB n=1 Tax=Thioalkalicoccus limnaeus TaxID=120681 RepID=A0ABV4BAB6_9GAMM
MIEIAPNLTLDERDLTERFVRAPGPGGQKVNKVATAVQLRFQVRGVSDLPEAVRERLIALARRRISAEGFLTIEAHRFRSRERNRADAFERLAELLRRAAHAPTPRRRTRPTKASREQRLQLKRARSVTKRFRRPPPEA